MANDLVWLHEQLSICRERGEYMTDRLMEQQSVPMKIEQKESRNIRKGCAGRRIIEAAILLAGMVSFWGFLYPELSLTEDAQVKSYIAMHIKEWTVAASFLNSGGL